MFGFPEHDDDEAVRALDEVVGVRDARGSSGFDGELHLGPHVVRGTWVCGGALKSEEATEAFEFTIEIVFELARVLEPLVEAEGIGSELIEGDTEEEVEHDLKVVVHGGKRRRHSLELNGRVTIWFWIAVPPS
jgi:hypothetical protein